MPDVVDEGTGATGGSSPLHSNGGTSSWSVNWQGLLVVALIVPIAIIGWRLVDDPEPASPGEAGGDQRVGASTTAVPSTVVPTTTTTPPTTIPRPTAPLPVTTVQPERSVRIMGEMKPCRFGANCLAASFVIEGFEPHPGSYVCIYPNSSTEIGFNDNDVIDACLTADQGDTITIEVAGVRSATISEINLDGTG